MSATSQQVANFGRIAVFGNVSVIKTSISASATQYTSASGGLPIDLTTVLQQAGPFSLDTLNPGDIVDIYAPGLSANGFLPGGFQLGTPTYTTKPLASAQNTNNNRVLATCPATIRLFGTGSANHAAFGEIADGAVTDTIPIHLVVARGGENF
jgi:hypothetical protein